MAAQDHEQVTYNSPAGAMIGQSTSEKVAFFGTTPISQRAGASQATSLLSTASSTAIDTLTKAAIIELMNCLAAYGIWKGAA